METVKKLQAAVENAFKEFKAEVRELHKEHEFYKLFEVQDYLERENITLCLRVGSDELVDVDSDSFSRIIFETYTSLMEKALSDDSVTAEQLIKLTKQEYHLRYVINNPSFPRLLQQDSLLIVKLFQKTRKIEKQVLASLISDYPEALQPLFDFPDVKEQLSKEIDKIICYFDTERITDSHLKRIIKFASDNGINLSRKAKIIKAGICFLAES